MTHRRIPWGQVEALLHELPGRPWRRGARGPDAFDCWGLVLYVRRLLALPEPPDRASQELSSAEVRRLFREAWPEGWRVTEGLAFGGIVLASNAGHAGVLVAGRVLHAQARTGVVAWTLGAWAAAFGPVATWELDAEVARG